MQEARRRSSTTIAVHHTDVAALSLRDMNVLGRDFPASGGIVRVRCAGLVVAKIFEAGIRLGVLTVMVADSVSAVCRAGL